jgi:hypothetical protein
MTTLEKFLVYGLGGSQVLVALLQMLRYAAEGNAGWMTAWVAVSVAGIGLVIWARRLLKEAI